MDSSTSRSSVVSISPTRAVSGGRSGTADPRVEHGVQEVDEEVDEHEQDGDHEDVALQLDVLTGEDRLADLLAHPRDPEDDLDDDRAADEHADVEAGDREERQARWAQRVAPEDAPVRD